MAREFVPLKIGVLRVLETGTVADDGDVEGLVERLGEVGHVIATRETVTDSKSLIREQLTTWIADRGIDVIIAIGGIDSTPTDPMLDALAPLVSRQFFGFGELFRAIIHEEAGTASIFSHAEAALCNSTYVILLPASGFTTAAVERLLLPQLDHRTEPRNLAMSLPRLAGVPQETMGGDTPTPSSRGLRPPPVPRTTTGTIPVTSVPPPASPHQTSRIAVPPAPPTKRVSTIMPAVRDESNVRRPPTTPGIAPLVVPPEEPARPKNPFAEALKDAAQQRRTASVVAQMPKADPQPIAPPPVVAAAEPSISSPEIETPEPEPESERLPETSSGTINMDALLTAVAAIEETAPPQVKAKLMTAPPPFVKRNPTNSLPIVKAAVAEEPPPPARPATVKSQPEGDFRELAITPTKERGSPRMFVEGRRKRRSPQQVAVVLLLVVAGLSAVAAVVTVVLSMKRSHPTADPKRPPIIEQPVAAAIEMDAAVVPQHDPVIVDANAEIEMPAIGEPVVDAGALALKAPPPVHPVPQHDPVVPRDAAAIPMQDDGCDEVSCVLDHYVRPCCATFKPKDPDPALPPPSTTPAKLDRAMVAPAVEAIKPTVIACGERPNVPKGTVKLQVHVGPDGHVTFVTIAETPDQALGDCVSRAMQHAVFPVTETGGGFTYPFVF